MYCPKCGQQNPETGKFCRSCGTDLGNVSQVLSGDLPAERGPGHKKRPPSCEAAYTQMAMGAAFVVVAIILGATGRGSGWWFWLFIPAFFMVANGLAKLTQAKSTKRAEHADFAAGSNPSIGSAPVASLAPVQPEFVPSAESRYKTGELVPPSVTESTTRHLEIDSEGKTMTLPKD